METIYPLRAPGNRPSKLSNWQKTRCGSVSLRKPSFPLNITDPRVQAYCELFSSAEEDLLGQVSASTLAHPKGHMLSGHLQGSFLAFISIILQPRYILEIGTFTGYSALCLAKGLQPGGRLHTIEQRPDDAGTATENFRMAKAQDKIILHLGNALDIIPSLDLEWDLVFLDADKSNYLAYYALVLPSLRKGGLILADNVLFHGQVLDKTVKGKNAIGIQAFNEAVKQDPAVDHVMLPLRDGLMLIRKK